MTFRHCQVEYMRVTVCPLCGGDGTARAQVQRTDYYFGRLQIPLPKEGITLVECSRCSLLFKSAIPMPKDLDRVMSASATEVWREKAGEHPALAMMRPHVEGAQHFLDVGASNGDLLRQIKGDRISALDIVEYPKCREVVTGEYIIGPLDDTLKWSGLGYDVVTAFDIFEHFLAADRAVRNVLNLVKTGGRLIIETGDWQTVRDQGRWYYANLFEHQIFWTRRTFEYICRQYHWELAEYSLVNHKGRRTMGWHKRAALSVITALAAVPLVSRSMLAMAGRDPGHFGPPTLVDHAFVVLVRRRPEWPPLPVATGP